MKSECEYYLYGAKMAIKLDNQKKISSICKDILYILYNELEYCYIEDQDESEIAITISTATKFCVIRDGDSWNNLNSVGWFMGLVCHTLCKNYSEYFGKFDYLFEQGWNEYFNEIP